MVEVEVDVVATSMAERMDYESEVVAIPLIAAMAFDTVLYSTKDVKIVVYDAANDAAYDTASLLVSIQVPLPTKVVLI
jgi:hypothetical protein